jgi:hypothetical protein
MQRDCLHCIDARQSKIERRIHSLDRTAAPIIEQVRVRPASSREPARTIPCSGIENLILIDREVLCARV